MAKPVPRLKVKAQPQKGRKPKAQTLQIVPPPLVTFSFQQVAYQLDLEKSKVYRRFIEIEKSRQFSILSAYRSGSRPSA